MENLDSYVHFEIVKDVFLFMDIYMPISRKKLNGLKSSSDLQSIMFKLEMQYQEVTIKNVHQVCKLYNKKHL